MAAVIRSALALSKTPCGPTPANPAPPPAIDLDTARLDEIIGVKGSANGGVYQFGVPRRDPIMEMGLRVTGPLGGANAINFQPTGNGKAAITADFLVAGDEVNPLIPPSPANHTEAPATPNHPSTTQPHPTFTT